MRLLVTGGAGFIGSNFVHYVLKRHEDEVVVLDKLTYAGNRENLRDLEGNPRYAFIRGDIAEPAVVRAAMEGADAVVNFAAESHVDRSILEPGSFIQTDIYGAYVLLEEARSIGLTRFVQVSTDEVYGEILGAASNESDPLRPRNPYSASKAAGELLVQAYHSTYGLPVLVTRGSNTFGPYQYPEKLLPVAITEAIDDRPVPVYGDGLQVRDWLYVEDHCAALDWILKKGSPGQAYNIGAGNRRTNLEIIERVLDLLDRPRSLAQYVPDRPGHDRGYFLDATKLVGLGWRPQHPFEQALAETVRWYVENESWWRSIKGTPDYQEYFLRNYGDRQALLPTP